MLVMHCHFSRLFSGEISYLKVDFGLVVVPVLQKADRRM